MHRRAYIGVALGVLLLGVFLIQPFSNQYGVNNTDFRGIALAGEAVALDCQFGDIDNHPWGVGVMREMVRLGILQGYPGQVTDTYGNPVTKYFAEPEKAISRAEFATLLARSLNLPTKESDVSFGDWWEVPGWARGAVAALFDRGIVEGTQGADGNMYFRPSQEITRAEIAVMVMRALDMDTKIQDGVLGGSQDSALAGALDGPQDSLPDSTQGEVNDTGRSETNRIDPGEANNASHDTAIRNAASDAAVNNPFCDVREDDWFYDGVLNAYRQGIVNGRTDTSFSPAMSAKRVEVMTILHRMLEKDGSFSPADGELVGLVDDYYGRAQNYLRGGGSKDLQAILTGGAAYSFSTGGVGVLESTPLPGDIAVRIISGDGGTEVITKSGRLARVSRDTVIHLEPENETIPRLRIAVQEDFSLFRTTAGWKIYSVEVKSSKITEVFG
ncbi:MAG TPA: S-layer homology domain-containing protein [Clostridia bacterium]|nr:S-layer homology domain-containing protein [Clostridia bacterium]